MKDKANQPPSNKQQKPPIPNQSSKKVKQAQALTAIYNPRLSQHLQQEIVKGQCIVTPKQCHHRLAFRFFLRHLHLPDYQWTAAMWLVLPLEPGHTCWFRIPCSPGKSRVSDGSKNDSWSKTSVLAVAVSRRTHDRPSLCGCSHRESPWDTVPSPPLRKRFWASLINRMRFTPSLCLTSQTFWTLADGEDSRSHTPYSQRWNAMSRVSARKPSKIEIWRCCVTCSHLTNISYYAFVRSHHLQLDSFLFFGAILFSSG